MEIKTITDFWLTEYLDSYITVGGSKIKFLTGSAGSGKTRCLRQFLQGAAGRDCKVVELSAKSVWIHDFKEVYTAILQAVDLPGCLAKCADTVIREMGHDTGCIPRDQRFADYLADRGEFDPLTRRELRSRLSGLFYQNPHMDKNFAVSAALLTGNILGYPVLEPAAEATVKDWLAGARGLRVAELRKLGLSGAKVSRQNARHMLRSLIEVLKMAGFGGLVVGVDNLEILVSLSSLEEIRYTKLRREDAYECIRELIDEIDTLTNAMFVFAFDKSLLEDESAGFKSYQALWMRIQNEVEGERLNRFADIVDLDRLSAEGESVHG